MITRLFSTNCWEFTLSKIILYGILKIDGFESPSFSFFTHPTMLRALGGIQKFDFVYLQRYLRKWGNMISVAPLVVPIVKKQE